MEREKGEAGNFEVSFSALRKDVANVLDLMERLMNEEDKKAVDVDVIEKLKLKLIFICTYVQLSYSDLEQFKDIMTSKRQEVEDLLRPILDDVDNNVRCKYNMHHVLSSLADNINDCISSRHHFKSNVTMTDEQLDFLLLNLHHLSKYHAEKMIFPLVTQYEILQNVCGNVKDFHGLIVNGCIKHDMVENVLPLFQLMAERVGHFLWEDQIDQDSQLSELDEDDQTDEDSQLSELAGDNQTDEDSELPGLAEDDKIDEEKSMNRESTNETNRATLYLQENIELLKEDLKHVYLIAPNSSQCCFPFSDGPLFMHLLPIHLNDLLDSNAYSVALIKEEIALVKQDLEFIRSFFVNVEQGLYKDLCARVLDVAYEAKDVIDSIIVRDSGLLHLIFSLRITIKKIKLIKEDISNLIEKITKNKSVIVVNTPKKLVESKSLTNGKIIVGFEEETNLIIRKLTSGPAYLDVISITGIPGSGKTTLAQKVYNDQKISSHFDLRAWCTVDQNYDEKKLLDSIFNQVIDLDSKLNKNIDVADKLRKQLYGKRYLIVLDDEWDTTTWDELTRPFPEVEKGSRVILTTREKEVALHGKLYTDPLNLRLLRSEESWELLEKRAFGNESCPDELLKVGKEIAQNCKGLPLVADLIAGVIAGREKKKSLWLEFQTNLNSFSLNNEVEVMKVIELSYDHLSDHLKPCLLYLARYSKDTGIIISALIDFWRVEGLVGQAESVEEVMKVYLDNLISSSLVIIFNEISEYPSCQFHDLVHDFCLIKSRKEKFFCSISSSAASSSSDLMPHIVTIDYHSEIFGPNNFVMFGSNKKNKKRHSGEHLYSLRINGDKLDDHLFDTFHLRHLRLLRVLYLESSLSKKTSPI